MLLRLSEIFSEMYVIDRLLEDLYLFLNVSADVGNIVRIHSRKLKLNGDASFPLKLNAWYRALHSIESANIPRLVQFAAKTHSSNSTNDDFESCIKDLLECSKQWDIPLKGAINNENNMNLHLERSTAFRKTIQECHLMTDKYGAVKRSSKLRLTIKINETLESDRSITSLTNLRLIVLQEITQNLVDFCLNDIDCENNVLISLSLKKNHENDILCGPVTTDSEISISAQVLYNKRSTDMRLMAEHKYGLRMKSTKPWDEYFEKLGKSAVTMELIENKTHKSVKISLNHTGTCNKGAAFIFYNCARLLALLKKFDERVENKDYQDLISFEDVDFSLLQEPEEWEILYVYIMQYPLLIKSCIRDVEKGIINLHHLASFLYNLCTVFSVYYRRVRVLVTPRVHLMPTLCARIYLLKSLKQVFLKTLQLLNIDPINEM